MELSNLIEQAAEQVVLMDPSDPDALQQLKSLVKSIAQSLDQDEASHDSRDALRSAHDLLNKVIRNELPDPSPALEWITGVITVLQTRVCRNQAADFPSCPLDPPQPPAVKPPPPPVSVVDQELVNMFLDHQMSVLPEIEQHILDYEKDPAPKHISGIRRIIHTMKGEAGFTELNAIQQACHALEEYLERNAHPSPELLFAAKDWLAKATEHCAQTGEELDPAELEAALASAPQPAREMAPAAAGQPESTTGMPEVRLDADNMDLTTDFVSEATDRLASIDQTLLLLEQRPDDQEAIANAFRCVHTIKGIAGFLALEPIEQLAHHAETILDKVRNEHLRFEGSVVDAIFISVDVLKQMVNDLHQCITSGSLCFSAPPQLGQLIRDLDSLHDQADAPASPADAKTAKTAETPPPVPSTPLAESAPAEPDSSSTTPARAQAAPTRNGEGGNTIQQPVKIDAERLDSLINTIGELVIAESIVAQDPDLLAIKSLRLERNLSLLGKITRMLQDMGMAMRMMPIEPTFRKMARLVRDLSKKSGKPVDFRMIGQETELDRALVDKLGDPLIHMVRNSMDHGIEDSTAERKRLGKPAQATITLKAFHKGGNIHIHIQDDGRGLNRARIEKKAIERGLLGPAEAANKTDTEIFSYIFESGFSTAAQITEISGRGVGMDVVKRSVESMRGSILIESEQGKGTTFTIVLPLTTAIIDGMLVQVGSELYIIPTLAIVESFRPAKEALQTLKDKGELVHFRERVLPVFRLAKVFDIEGGETDATQSIMVVVEDAGRQVALLVDDLLGQQQTVIKSLGDALGQLPGISGASIMTDGRPGLIIDVPGLVKLAMNGGVG